MTSPILSIVIVNFNAKRYLEQCLHSIFDHPVRATLEVILVDNASSDDSLHVVAEKFPLVKLIRNERNEGFIKANNLGIRQASGQYVLSLNNDTKVLAGALDALVGYMDSNLDVGACGGKLLNVDGTIQHQCKRGFPTPSSTLFYFLKLHKLFPKNRIFGHYLLTYLDPSKISDVDSLSGACLLVRRRVIQSVGIMDEAFIMYGDDLDWCYRIKHAGWRVVYVPQAEIVHYGGMGGSRAMPYRNIWEFHRSMAVFYRKHYAAESFFLLNWIVYSAVWAKAFLVLGATFLRKEKVVGSRKPAERAIGTNAASR